MSRRASGIIPAFLCLFATFLLFAGCLTSPTSEPEPEKPAVTVDATLLDFGESLDSLNFFVTFTGGKTDWSLSDGELPSWCTVTVKGLTTGARVTVSVNRSTLSPGAYSSSITVKWNTDSHTIEIRMVVPKTGKDTGTIIIDTQLPE